MESGADQHGNKFSHLWGSTMVISFKTLIDRKQLHPVIPTPAKMYGNSHTQKLSSGLGYLRIGSANKRLQDMDRFTGTGGDKMMSVQSPLW